MQDAPKIPCTECLFPQDRVFYDEVQKLIRQHGFSCAALSEIVPMSRTSPAKGLCITCIKRDVCAEVFREGGVWHCIAYE